MERPRYIAVEGPVGVGKTAFAHILANRMGAKVVLEQSDQNPFLKAFYGDPKKFAFQAQLFFLLSRYRQQEALTQQDLFARSTVSDYLFARDRIFAALTLSMDELVLYERIYESSLRPRTGQPDLVVYLQARSDVLLRRVKRRGREGDRLIEPAYLEEIAKAYREFFFHWEETPLLVVNTSDIDLENEPDDVEDLMNVIRRHKKGTQHYVPLGTKTG